MTQKTWKEELHEIIRLKDSFVITNIGLVKELEALPNSQDEVVALLYARRCLEVIITDICLDKLCRERGSEPLNSLIDRLWKEKVIPEYIYTSMQNLNRISTYGAHPKEFDPRQVRTAVIELNTILDWFTGEKKYEALPNTKSTSTNNKQTENKEASAILSPIANTIIKNEKTLTEKISIKKKNNVKVIAGAGIGLIVFLVLILIFYHQRPVKTEKFVAKTIRQDSIQKGQLSVKPAKTADTIPVKIEKEKHADKPINQLQTLHATSLSQTESKPTKPQEKKIKENTAKPAENTSDISTLLLKVSDKNLPFAQRQKIAEQIKMACTSNSYVNIMVDSNIMDKIPIDEYLNRLMILANQKATIIRKETNSQQKIISLDITEEKK